MVANSFFTPRGCPCGSGVRFDQCCGAVLQGKPAATAEALMRSRYVAHVEGDSGHLLSTWHPSTRPDDADVGGGVRWLGLEIVEVVDGGPDDDEGIVEFVASYQDQGNESVHRERSAFLRHRGRWHYVDAVDGA